MGSGVSKQESTEAFHAAVGSGDEVSVARMLDSPHATRENLSIPGSDGRTALMNAAVRGHVSVIELLIKSGADVNYRDPETGMNVLMLAAKVGNDPLLGSLLEAKGVDLEARDNSGNTALYHAAWWGHVAACRLLVERGANVNARCQDGRTALTAAVLQNSSGVVELLLENDADVTITDEQGNTPQHYADTNTLKVIRAKLVHRLH